MFWRCSCSARHRRRWTAGRAAAGRLGLARHLSTRPERPYTPPDAPLEMFKALHDRLGVERAVIVKATPHGRDNRVVTDAIAQSGGRYKGVANVDETFSDRDLQRLADAGITGCRFTFLPRLGKLPDMSSFDRIVERIAALDWHVDLYLPATLLSDFRPRLTALPVPY